MSKAEEHDYDTCRERYCLMCFYIWMALHPEEAKEIEGEMKEIINAPKDKPMS